MVAGLNGPIELCVALRLEDRIAVKGGREIKQPAWAHQGTECGQRRGDIYQVEKSPSNQQVPGPSAEFAGNETCDVDRLSFYRDILPCPAHMQLSLAALVHQKTPLVSPLG